jgi:hypothetical protein
MSERIPVVLQDLDRAASVARTLEHADALGALCLDVLGRQAEGRSLYAGAKFIKGRAKEHGVTRGEAETPLGNLLEMLERGPQSNLERALVAALFLRGFGSEVRARPEQRKALCEKLAVHCDWLELHSPYRVLPLVEPMLDPDVADDVLRALGALVLGDDAPGNEAAARARNAGRISVLSQSSSSAARAALERIAAEAQDNWSAALAMLALGKPSVRPPHACEVHGRAGVFPRGPLRSFARWASGYALLSWAFRVVTSAVGYRSEIDLVLRGSAITARQSITLLGRVVRSSEQVHAVAIVRSAGRAARYPSLPLVLGAFCFALGIVLGGLFALDAARVGDSVLWFAAAAFMLTGSGLDLLLEVVLPGSRGRVVLDLDFGPPHGVRLTGVPLAEADHFLNELSQCLVTQGGRRAVA